MEYVRIPLRRRDGATVAHAIVDREDAHLAEHRWCFNADGYVVRTARADNGRWGTDYLHRCVLGLVCGDGQAVDHIDRDKLNNRRSNLRIATRAMNAQNQDKGLGKSGVRGVHSRKGRWSVAVVANGKTHYGGTFDTIQEAAECATQLRARLHPWAPGNEAA